MIQQTIKFPQRESGYQTKKDSKRVGTKQNGTHQNAYKYQSRQGTFNEIIQNYTIYVPPKGFSRLIIWLQTYKNPLNYGQQTMVILLSVLTAFG